MTAIRLYEFVEDEQVLLAELVPAELPWEYAVTSDSFNGADLEVSHSHSR